MAHIRAEFPTSQSLERWVLPKRHVPTVARPDEQALTPRLRDQYLLASKKLPQAWHLHCIVITWLPKSEMISVSVDLQNGHAGFGLSTGRHVSLFR
jgi:hypothetical protein